MSAITTSVPSGLACAGGFLTRDTAARIPAALDIGDEIEHLRGAVVDPARCWKISASPDAQPERRARRPQAGEVVSGVWEERVRGSPTP